MKKIFCFLLTFLVCQIGLATTTGYVSNPIIPGLSNIVICDTNADGMSVFDLTVQNAAILAAQIGNTSDYAISYHSTMADAQSGVTDISNPNAYYNVAPNNQTIYVRVTNISTNEYTVGSFVLTVHIPLALATPTPLAKCDSDTNPNNQITAFDLTVKNNEITQGATGGYTITYFPSLNSAYSGTDPITTPTSYTNSQPAVQTLGVKVTSAQGCISYTTLDIRVYPVPVLVIPPDLISCDGDNNGVATFDLGTNINYISNSDPNLVFHFFTSLQNATYNVNEITNASAYSSATGDVWVRAENQYTEYQANHCYSIVKQHLVVVNGAAPITSQPNYPPYELCDTSGVLGSETFDLASKVSEILLGQAGMYVTFYPSLADAQNNTGAISNFHYVNVTLYVQTLGIRVTNSCSGTYAVSTMDIKVSPLPQLVPPSQPISYCDPNNDGFGCFDLSSIIPDLTQGSGTVVRFYETMTDAEIGGIASLTSPYCNIQPNTQTIYVRGENPVTGCYSIIQIVLQINSVPEATQPNDYELCDISNDGVETFDLNIIVPEVLGAINPADHTVTMYTSLANAEAGIGPIFPTTNYSGSNGEIIWIRVANNATECYDIVPLHLVLHPTPNVQLVSNNTLNTVYVDGSNAVVQPLSLDTQLSGNYSYHWEMNGAPIPNANGSGYVVNTPLPGGEDSVFSVAVEDITTGCASGASIIISQSSGVPSPLGPISQTFNPGETLAYLTVSGNNIQWYASVSNKNTAATPLPLNTLLVDGTTYYASQTVGGFESESRLPVTVHAALGLPDNGLLSLQYAPNPVKGVLHLESDSVLKSISVYNLLGQKVLEKTLDTAHATIDLSQLKTGNYIIKLQNETSQKVIKIVKQ